MATSEPTVLFLTPGASSVGGNIFLLNFLRWFKRNTDIPFITLFGHGGDLEKEFAELGPAFNVGYEWAGLGGMAKNRQRLRKYFRVAERNAAREIARRTIGLIYSNAVTNHYAMPIISGIEAPLIAHCHELETLIQKTGPKEFAQLQARADLFVAAAQAVKDNLVVNHEIDEKTIEVIHEFIPLAERSDTAVASAGSVVLSELGIPENAFVVGASGTVYWRKGPDVFIQLAAEVRKQDPGAQIYFVWIGGARRGDTGLIEAEHDIQKLGLADRVRFVEHLLDPSGHYAALDVFALTSREDPFPLVCLEAAALGKPILCFAEAGGMPEFVGQERGFVVPYLDISELADRVLRLYNDSELTERLGNAARQRVRENHNIETSAPKMLKLIERYLRK